MIVILTLYLAGRDENRPSCKLRLAFCWLESSNLTHSNFLIVLTYPKSKRITLKCWTASRHKQFNCGNARSVPAKRPLANIGIAANMSQSHAWLCPAVSRWALAPVSGIEKPRLTSCGWSRFMLNANLNESSVELRCDFEFAIEFDPG